LKDLSREGLRVGLADPDGVCVGLYAVEILDVNGLLNEVRPNLLGMVESCAKAAAMIPLNLVDVVLGWREFAAWKPDVMTAVLLNPEELPRLAYIPAAMLKQAKNPQGANAFISFLKSKQGQAIFQKWGYLTDENAARVFAPKARIGGNYQLPEGW
jgi:molybdate transport system substrate-binding protein